MEFCHALASQEKVFSFSIKIGNTFSFSLDTKEKAQAPQARKVSPSTQKRNSLRRQKFLASEATLQDERMEKTANISVIPDVNDTQDVTLAQKDDLCSSPFRCDQCDFSTKTSCALKMHVSKQHKISQLDGGDEVLERNISDKYEEPIILSMQDNGRSKLEMIDPDEASPSKVIHPKLGSGTSPRGVLVEDSHSPIVVEMQDEKTHIENTFHKGKFIIKINMKPKEGHSHSPIVVGMQDKKTHIEYTFHKGKFIIKIDMKPKEGHSRQMKA